MSGAYVYGKVKDYYLLIDSLILKLYQLRRRAEL